MKTNKSINLLDSDLKLVDTKSDHRETYLINLDYEIIKTIT